MLSFCTSKWTEIRLVAGLRTDLGKAEILNTHCEILHTPLISTSIIASSISIVTWYQPAFAFTAQRYTK